MAKTPDYMTAFDALFGDAGYEKYLSSLTSQGGAAVGLKEPAATAKPTQRVLTEDEKKFGSYGTVRDIAGTDLTDLDSVAAMAKRGGWADPKAFSLDMLDGPGKRDTAGEGGELNTGRTKFKDDIAIARGINGTKRNQNVVETTWDDNPTVSGPTFWDGGETTTFNPQVSGYKVRAGAIPGTKNHTSLYYQYDKDGKFQGANFDMEERGLQGAAPLVGMAGMALGFGGGLGALGSGLNSSLGLGLGNVGQAALGGAAFGGGAAALTGQNPIKGAAMGALGAGITAANPAGSMGLTGAPARFVNSTISNLTKSTLNRKSS